MRPRTGHPAGASPPMADVGDVDQVDLVATASRLGGAPEDRAEGGRAVVNTVACLGKGEGRMRRIRLSLAILHVREDPFVMIKAMLDCDKRRRLNGQKTNSRCDV